MKKSFLANKKAFSILFMMLMLFSILSLSVEATEDNDVTVHFFWGDGCPYCAEQKLHMEELEDRYPEVIFHDYEVYSSSENQKLMSEMASEHGTTATGVPMTFIGDEYWSGFSEENIEEMDEEIQDLLQRYGDSNDTGKDENIIDVPLVGSVDLNQMPFLATTFVISFIDGFNPCSLWLLTFLLGILILTKSRKKIIMVGLAFLLTTTLVYGSFIAGLFNVFAYTRLIDHIKWFVGIIALIFAIVNIKDYFWYKKGISFTISDKHKPSLFKKMRRIMHPNQSLPSMVGATIALALGVTLVELPCTAGFPMIWSSMASELSLPLLAFLGYLALYLLIYLSVEIVILLVAVITMSRINFGEKHGRILKLVSGVIMFVLGISFIFLYDYMNTFQGLFNMMLTAFGIIIATLLIHRKMLPAFGIQLGTETLYEKNNHKDEDGDGAGKHKKGDGDADE